MADNDKLIPKTIPEIRKKAGAIPNRDSEVGFSSRLLGRVNTFDPAAEVAGIADGQHDLLPKEIESARRIMFRER